MKTARWRALGRTDVSVMQRSDGPRAGIMGLRRRDRSGKKEGSDCAEPSAEGAGRVDYRKPPSH